jgi:hypothetical protein
MRRRNDYNEKPVLTYRDGTPDSSQRASREKSSGKPILLCKLSLKESRAYGKVSYDLLALVGTGVAALLVLVGVAALLVGVASLLVIVGVADLLVLVEVAVLLVRVACVVFVAVGVEEVVLAVVPPQATSTTRTKVRANARTKIRDHRFCAIVLNSLNALKVC